MGVRKDNRAGIYCRVSTEMQRHGDGLRRQESWCREYAEKQGFIVQEDCVYREVLSGGSAFRPEVLHFLHDASRRKFGHLIVEHMDRLSRTPLVQWKWLAYALDEMCVELHFAMEPGKEHTQFCRELALSIERSGGRLLVWE